MPGAASGPLCEIADRTKDPATDLAVVRAGAIDAVLFKRAGRHPDEACGCGRAKYCALPGSIAFDAGCAVSVRLNPVDLVDRFCGQDGGRAFIGRRTPDATFSPVSQIRDRVDDAAADLLYFGPVP
jgi:hypothetical protein